MKKIGKKDYWKIAGIVILVILAWNWIDNNDDYEFCIDNCYYSMSDCFYTYRFYDEVSNSYLGKEDSDICLMGLKSCIEDCKK